MARTQLFSLGTKVGGSEASTLLKLFVYGTLKKGEPKHQWLTKPDNGVARFLGVGKTAVKYPLVIASKYNIPVLLDVPGTGNHVEGEVYEVDDKMLSNLDQLEVYLTYYTRREEKILLADDREEKCFTYFLDGLKPSLLELPTLTSYSSLGDHGLVYIESYNESAMLADIF